MMRPRYPLPETLTELAELVENLEIHHPQRDGDYLRPQELRGLVRMIYLTILEMYGILKVDYDKSE